eukprot:g7781.t1
MKEEHEAFLRGVEMYNKDWHLIATVVKTRSVLQIRTHGQKYFTKLAKGEVFPLEPYRSMYDKPPSSASTAVPPPPPFDQGGGGLIWHQLNGSASHASPWAGNVSFDMSQGSGVGVGVGGDSSRGQMLRYLYPHPQLLQAGPVAPPGLDELSSTMLHMTPASADGPLTQSQSSGSSSSLLSSPASSPAANWGGATSSMDHSLRFGESMSGRPVDAATVSTFTATSLPPLCPSSGGSGGSFSTPGYPGAGFAGGAASGWPGGGVPGGASEGTNERAVGGQYSVQPQQQRQLRQQQQEHVHACAEGSERQQGHQPPLLPEGLGPLEDWLNSPLLQGEEAGTEDPDGDLALDCVARIRARSDERAKFTVMPCVTERDKIDVFCCVR